MSGYITVGTNLYRRGKYAKDNRWDPFAVGRQLGVLTILHRAKERGVSLPFP